MSFRIIVPLVVFSLQALLYYRASQWVSTSFPGKPSLLWTLRGIFLLFNTVAAIVFITRPVLADFPPWMMYWGVYPYFIWHGATLFIGVIVLAGWIVQLPFHVGWRGLKLIPSFRRKVTAPPTSIHVERFDASRRLFLRRGMYGISAAAFAGSTYGMLLERGACEMNSTEFALKGLHSDLDGLTITFLSDIHSGNYMGREEMDEYVRLANSLQSDMIIVCGDFVNSAVDEVYPFAESFSSLSAPLGVFGVMGNHDFYNRNPDLVAKEVDECGIRLLRDDRTSIHRGAGSLYLIGVDDVGRANRAPIKLAQAIGKATDGLPSVLLCHRPYYLAEAASHGIDLVLSGHTHGGQVVLGRFGDVVIAPASLASPYVSGKYSLKDTQMYVSRGIGTVGVPIRLNCPPEITQITLRQAVQS